MPTPKEIAQANVAKQLLPALCYPLVVNLKSIIKTNAIWDTSVTESNIKLMEHLHGPNIPTVKGKTTRQCPHKLVSDMVSIPHEFHDTQHDVGLYIDIKYINGMPFLTTMFSQADETVNLTENCEMQTILKLLDAAVE